MNKIKFSTKANNLINLKKIVKTAKVLDQITFTVKEYNSNSKRIIDLLKKKKWLNTPLIIRSSSFHEDSHENSGAGQFFTALNVTGLQDIKSSISKVISSYKNIRNEDQVFIQKYLSNVKISGVIFTRDINNNSPYIKINYDDSSGKTDTITSGCSTRDKVFYYHKLHTKNLKGFKNNLILLSKELENIFNNDALDIEFAIDNKNTLYLLQVRPLLISNKKKIGDQQHYKIVKNISSRIKPWLKKQPNIHGKNGMYGIMPDWNPAEIIGCKPKPLSLSLYRELITNSIWAYQRNNYGYKNLRSFPLLIEIEGIPYIDVRVSFNSFIPKTLENNIAEKLVNYYLNKLKKSPDLHDKIEFDIVFSCYTLDTKKNLEKFKKNGFKISEIKKINDALLEITNNIISKKSLLIKKDLEKIQVLEKNYKLVLNSKIDNFAKIYWLIEDCKRYGTLPFAGLARAAFISIEMLKSFVNQKIISEEDYNAFLSTLNTVSSSLVNDFNILNKKQFLKKYGHLRPGTYDILSKSYKDGFNEYFKWNDKSKVKENTNFKFTSEQLSNINIYLKKSKINTNAKDLLKFIKKSIESREYAKFMFTKNISEILKIYENECLDKNISKEDASYTHISSIMSLNSIITDSDKIIRTSIERRKRRFEYTKLVNLPNLINHHDDVFYFFEPESSPNFITQKNVTSEIIIINNNKFTNIDNKIIFIENADPGYDWIFSHKISGIVTKYGGANSHMAIRAAELNIPSVIGAGSLYDKIIDSRKIKIDTTEKKIIVIN